MKNIVEQKNYYLEKGSSEIEIIFYPEKRWFSVIFLCVWIMGWAVAEIIVIDQLINQEKIFDINFSTENDSNLFLFVWVIIWTYGGIMAIISLLWEVSGEQYVYINRRNLKIEKRLGFISKTKVFDLDKINGLMITQKTKNSKTQEFYRSSFFRQVGYIGFYYKGKKIRFGLDIKKEEAGDILNKIKEISRFTDLKIGEINL